MIEFLIKSSICLVVFLGFYHLILEREKIHVFNRFYLLFSIVISFTIPFLTFEIIKIIPTVEEINTTLPITPISFEETKATINYLPIVLWCLYSLVTFVLCIRFGKNIWKLVSKSNVNPSVGYKNANLILIDEKTLPHTFLNSIFINSEDYTNRNIEDELYTHELVHVTQKHTLDILFIEFLKVVFWFNPLFYFYKKAIQLNHEFLADEEIVKTYNNVPFYQSLLLQKSIGNQTIYLASNLNYLVTKKRLIMMTKSTSQKIALLKKVAIVPILAGLIYFFCIEIVAQEKPPILQQLSESKLVESNRKNTLTLNDTVKKKKVDISITGGEKVKINGEIFEKTEDKYFNEKGSFDSTGKNKYRYGYIKINNITHVYNTKDNGSIEYFNKDGKRVDLNGKEVDQKANLENATASKKQENDIFNTTEVTEKPDFIGGMEAFYKYIGLNYNIPNEVADFKLKGKIFAKFIIEKDGSFSNIEILQDMGYGTGEEALRVLQNCPKWKPGKIKEEVVRTQYSLPIMIQSAN